MPRQISPITPIGLKISPTALPGTNARLSVQYHPERIDAITTRLFRQMERMSNIPGIGPLKGAWGHVSASLALFQDHRNRSTTSAETVFLVNSSGAIEMALTYVPRIESLDMPLSIIGLTHAPHSLSTNHTGISGPEREAAERALVNWVIAGQETVIIPGAPMGETTENAFRPFGSLTAIDSETAGMNLIFAAVNSGTVINNPQELTVERKINPDAPTELISI